MSFWRMSRMRDWTQDVLLVFVLGCVLAMGVLCAREHRRSRREAVEEWYRDCRSMALGDVAAPSGAESWCGVEAKRIWGDAAKDLR